MKYIYLMKHEREKTVKDLNGMARILDIRQWYRKYPRGNRLYWGWVVLDHPIELLDACDIGLMPVYKESQI